MPAVYELTTLEIKVFSKAKVYEALQQPKVAQDPLKFRDSKKYSDRLKDSRVKAARVRVEKPDIIPNARSVGVEIERTR